MNFSIGVVITLVVYVIFFMFQVLYTMVPLFSVKGKRSIEKDEPEDGLSILIPAYNEETIIKNCILAIVNVDYKNYEAIIVNDGSTDDTMKLLISILDLKKIEREKAGHLSHKPIRGIYQSTLYPSILIIDKDNGGKADALNAGLEFAENETVITLDADSQLDVNSLKFINSAFKDKKVIAAGGMVHIGQAFYGDYTNPQLQLNKSNLLKYQFMQYIENFYLYKITQAKFKSLAIISGAFGVFKRDIVFKVGGYRITVGEDMDITMRVQRLIKTKYTDKKVLFIPEAVCFTEAPETLRGLFNQRIRWEKAFIDCIITYSSSFNKFGLGLPMFLLVDGLMLGTLTAFPTLIIPFIVLIMGEGTVLALMLFAFSFSLGIYQSIVSLIIANRFGITLSKKDKVCMAYFIPFEIVTYRLLGVLFNTFGTINYFINKNSWNRVSRVGTLHHIYKENLQDDREEVYKENIG
jgi:biofilm PGA synthesis N-glycosyltransferase PgaC